MTCRECERANERAQAMARHLGYRLVRGEMVALQVRLRIPPSCARIALLLYNSAGAVGRDVVNSFGTDGSAKVALSALRKALPAQSIQTVGDDGYILTAVGRGAIRPLLAPFREDVAPIGIPPVAANDDHESMKLQLSILVGRLAAVVGARQTREMLIRMERALASHEPDGQGPLDVTIEG